MSPVDFSNNGAVFKHINSSKTVHLTQASTGHLLFPMTHDMYSQSEELREPFVLRYEVRDFRDNSS